MLDVILAQHRTYSGVPRSLALRRACGGEVRCEAVELIVERVRHRKLLELLVVEFPGGGTVWGVRVPAKGRVCPPEAVE